MTERAARDPTRPHDEQFGPTLSGDRGGADSFRALLPGLRPLVPPSLLDGAGWNRLGDRVGGLPGAAVLSACGFEFRLGDPEPVGDFATLVMPGGALERHHVDAGRAAQPGSPEAALARHLVRGGGGSADRITSHMLEYDIAGVANAKCSPPALFLRLFGRTRGGLTREDSGVAGRLVDVLADASGRVRDDGERHVVEGAVASLPVGAEIFQAGAFPGRTPRTVRLVARGMEAPAAVDFLQRLGETPPVKAMEAVLSEMNDVSPSFRLSFDLTGAGVSSRIGLEMAPPSMEGRSRWLEGTLEDWRPLIERLEARGWSLPEKARGLRAWTGRDKVFDSRGVFFLHRGISHIKLVIDRDTVSAKAYAGMMCSPVPAPVAPSV